MWNWFLLLRQEHHLNDSSEGFDKLLDALGTPPLFTVVRVNNLKTTVHDAQQQLQKFLEEVCFRKTSGELRGIEIPAYLHTFLWNVCFWRLLTPLQFQATHWRFCSGAEFWKPQIIKESRKLDWNFQSVSKRTFFMKSIWMDIFWNKTIHNLKCILKSTW